MKRKHIKKVKIKTNELFALAFNNIIKFNSDILSGFKPIILEIFDYMTNNINNTIKDSFGNFTSIHLYIENKINSKEKNDR